jgi:hypothetical protein
MADSNSTVEYRNISSDPRYRIGSDGSVWSCIKKKSLGGRNGTTSYESNEWKQMKTRLETRTGYRLVTIRNRRFRVHGLVLEAFVGLCPKGLMCCHNDGNAANNHLYNLRWDTSQSNQSDRNRHGTHNKGDRNGRRKLSLDIVDRIRREYAAGGIKQPELAKRYGVSRPAISLIVNNKTWITPTSSA